jgi:Protein of unknown function (DUF1552)
MKTSRRQFLRSSKAIIALPFLESLGWRRFASAALAPSSPKRMVFLGFGFGVTKETWYPDKKQTGANYKLPPGLEPLARHKKDFTLVQNLENKFNNEAHWGSTFWLTGANRYSEPGQSFHNSISADQVAAEEFGKKTRFPSIQLGSNDAEGSGHGPGLSLAWNRQGKPIGAYNTPVAVYHRLFSDDATPLSQRQAELIEKRSVLDTVMTDARSVGRSLSAADTDKLGEYMQSIRDIETRLSKEAEWLNVPKKKPSNLLEEPKGELLGYEEMKVMYDIMVAALQTDATRVLTYRQPVSNLYRSLDISMTAHNCSHYMPGERMEASQLRDVKQSALLAHFLDRLKATKESDGSSLFDNTCLSYGSNIHSIHYLDNCPTIVTGGAAGIKLGQHIVLPDTKVPLCNLWLTLLQGVGLPVKEHGDSTGIISQLI